MYPDEKKYFFSTSELMAVCQNEFGICLGGGTSETRERLTSAAPQTNTKQVLSYCHTTRRLKINIFLSTGTNITLSPCTGVLPQNFTRFRVEAVRKKIFFTGAQRRLPIYYIVVYSNISVLTVLYVEKLHLHSVCSLFCLLISSVARGVFTINP